MPAPEWFKRLAVPLADKIVYASSAYVGLKSTINGLGDVLINFDRPSTGPVDERLYDVARLIRPHTSDSLSLVRVGGDRDGGYVMADDFEHINGAISIGIGSDVTWDQAMSDRRIRVAMFDPTVRRLPERVKGGQFFRIGLGNGTETNPYWPLTKLLELAGMAGDSELVLKIDVEGAEWTSLEFTDASQLLPFRQIAIEVHGLADLHYEGSAARILKVLSLLSVNHLPIHVHANNYADLVSFDGNWFPNTVEVTYLRRDRIGTSRPSTVISSEHDQPCDPRVKEISLQALAGLP